MTDYERPSKLLAVKCVIAYALIELGFVTEVGLSPLTTQSNV